MAAEKVAGATLALLTSLVSKSLLRRTETGRYDLHDVIRQYALLQLNENELQHQAARDRHCEHYLKFVTDREKSIKSAAQQEAMQELTREIDNIRAAWVWGIERGKFQALAESVRCLGWMFEVGGLLREGIEQLELLIQVLKAYPHDPQAKKALGAAFIHQGLLNFRTGQFMNALQRYDEGIPILRTIDEPAILADALIFKGTIMLLNGEYMEARQIIEEGLACARAASDLWFSAYGLYNLGYIDSQMGAYQEGYAQMQRSLQIWRTLGDPHSISLGLNFLVETQIALEYYEEAKASMRESISLCERTRNRWGMGTAYRFLGLATLAAGQYHEALSSFQKSLEIFGEYVEGWDIAKTKIYIGETCLLAGEPVKASSAFVEALSLARDISSPPLMLDAITGLACLEIQSSPAEAAASLKLVASHVATTQRTRERACQMLLELEPPLRYEDVNATRERNSDQSLDLIADRLLSKLLS